MELNMKEKASNPRRQWAIVLGLLSCAFVVGVAVGWHAPMRSSATMQKEAPVAFYGRYGRRQGFYTPCPAGYKRLPSAFGSGLPYGDCVYAAPPAPILPECKTCDCPEDKPVCEPATGECKALECATCETALTDGQWGDGTPWKDVPGSAGKYTVNYFKYMKDSGYLCMFNDWTSSTNKICPDNYNYFQFWLKGGGKCKRDGKSVPMASTQWEIFLYGDETMKVLKAKEVVMPRGKPTGGFGNAGFGPTPNLEKPHTTYELCFPVGNDAEVQMELSDPTSSGSYGGKCVDGGITGEPNGQIVTIDNGGGVSNGQEPANTCTSNSDCTDPDPCCRAGLCSSDCSALPTSAPAPAPAPVGPCKQICLSSRKSTKNKCKWKGCRGCSSCSEDSSCDNTCASNKKTIKHKCRWNACKGCSFCPAPTPAPASAPVPPPPPACDPNKPTWFCRRDPTGKTKSHYPTCNEVNYNRICCIPNKAFVSTSKYQYSNCGKSRCVEDKRGVRPDMECSQPPPASRKCADEAKCIAEALNRADNHKGDVACTGKKCGDA